MSGRSIEDFLDDAEAFDALSDEDKARLMAAVHGLGPSDAVLMPAPLAHVSGLLNGVLLPGVVPMKAVLVARWSADGAVDLIEAEAVSFMVGPLKWF